MRGYPGCALAFYPWIQASGPRTPAEASAPALAQCTGRPSPLAQADTGQRTHGERQRTWTERRVAVANLNVQWVKFYINPKRDIEEAIDQFMEDTGMRAGDQTPDYEIRSIVTA